MTSRSDLLVRVRKLLALSTSSNVHEAASAAAAAQSLIARHALEELLAETDPLSAEQARDPITDGSEAPLESARRPRKWRVVLADGIASLNGGVAWSHERDGVTHLCFCGRASDRANVVVLWEWLLARITWLSATEGPGQSRAWHEAFRVGAVDAIVERLAAVSAPAVTGDSDDLPAVSPAALARVDARLAARAAAVDAFVAANLRLGRGRSLRVDRQGFARGHAAGLAVPLPKKPG